MAQSKSFFDDVKKELECSVCQELFSEVNEPKILKCLHTFCKNCLEAWLRMQREGQLSCPTCRQITECPDSNINSLPSNLFYKQMVDIVEAYSGTAQDNDNFLHCGNCEEKKPLKFYCFDCNTFLCEECAGAHTKWKLFKGHHVKEIGKFESSDVQDYARKSNVCKKHKDELRFYCENCNICICRDCAILEHRDDRNHNIVSLEQGFENKKSDITSKMKDVEAIASRLRDQKQTLEKKKARMLGSIDQATSEIHQVAEQWISFIRQNEAAMTKKLLEQKNSFQGTFSAQMCRLDEKLIEIDNSLVFSSGVLARKNLPEILNVEEILDQRFQEFSSEFLINLKFSCVKYVPNDASLSMNDMLGKLIFTKTDPMLTTADGEGLTQGTAGEECSFEIETRDSQGQRTYSRADKVGVDIQSENTGKVIAPEVTDSKNGCYQVKYKPKVAGKYRVCLSVDGYAIVGSPFQLEVNEKRRERRKRKEELCPICIVEYPMSQMVTFLQCQDRVCRFCVSQYITITIKHKNVLHLVCPCCGEPGNLGDEAVATEYFSNLDILIRGLVDKETHDVFQRKLRDRALMKEPNFRWCSHCPLGFICEQPCQIKMMCPHCQQCTCFKCKRQWEDQHEGTTCEQFAAWKEANDPEFQATGLAAYLKMNGIVCPVCKYQYYHSKGGSMHMRCALCSYEFCPGCYKCFLNNHGQNCRFSECCTLRGLHAHHPRDCYFYLRDRDPEELKELLRDNNVRYNTEPLENQGNDDSDDEATGAAAATPAHCKVSEQRETVSGLIDVECGEEAPAGYAGLCRKHYIEYLVNLVNDNLLDPADIMSGDDLKRVLKRGFVNPPEKPKRINDEQYRQLLLQTVKEHLPLPRKPPRKRILDDDDELLNLQNNEDTDSDDSDHF